MIKIRKTDLNNKFLEYTAQNLLILTGGISTNKIIQTNNVNHLEFEDDYTSGIVNQFTLKDPTQIGTVIVQNGITGLKTFSLITA